MHSRLLLLHNSISVALEEVNHTSHQQQNINHKSQSIALLSLLLYFTKFRRHRVSCGWYDCERERKGTITDDRTAVYLFYPEE